MRTSIATVSLSGSLTEKVEAVSRAGFDGVEIFENDLLGSPLAVTDPGVGRSIDTDDDQLLLIVRRLLRRAYHRHRTPGMRGQRDAQRGDDEQLLHHVGRLRSNDQ